MLQENPATRDVQPSNQRYRLAPVVRYSGGRDTVLLYSQFSGLVRTVPSNTAEKLLACTTFLTLDQHARNLQGRCNAALDVIRDELRSYVADGLFISESELLSEKSSGSNVVRSNDISSIGIPTRNRPELLLRATKSYLENLQQHQRRCRLVIADGSDEDEARRETENRLSALPPDQKSSVYYAGLLQKQRYAELLVSAGIPQEVVTFALFGHPAISSTIGANRNAILLETVGELALSVDDDSLCRISAPLGESEQIRLAPDNDAVHVRFFPDRETLLASSVFVDESVLSVHERLLGRTLNELASAADENLKIDGACTHLLSSLQKGQATIIASYLGICGDAGMGSPLAFIMDSRAQRQKLFDSDSDFRCALSSREIILMARQPTISHAGPWLGNGLAADNRCLLPPFPPNLRGEDTVFGHLLSTCFSDSYFAHLPRTLLHDPPTQRSYPVKPAMGFSDVLAAFIGAVPAWHRGGSPDRVLRQLGTYLIEVSSPSQKAFDDELRKLVLRQVSFMLSMMERDASRYNGIAPLWATEMNNVRESLLRSVTDDQIVPAELLNLFPRPEAGALTRDLVAGFGKLLSWWPDMIQASRWLQSRDQRLAQPLSQIRHLEGNCNMAATVSVGDEFGG